MQCEEVIHAYPKAAVTCLPLARDKHYNTGQEKSQEVNTMTKEQISEAVALLTLMSKLSPEERKRFLYMIEGAALVAAK